MSYFMHETLLINSSAHTAGNRKVKKHRGGGNRKKEGEKMTTVHLKVSLNIPKIISLLQDWVQVKLKFTEANNNGSRGQHPLIIKIPCMQGSLESDWLPFLLCLLGAFQKP